MPRKVRRIIITVSQSKQNTLFDVNNQLLCRKFWFFAVDRITPLNPQVFFPNAVSRDALAQNREQCNVL